MLEFKNKEYCNPIRCDNCIKCHYKCDKKLPICRTCRNKNIECTYTQKPKYKKKSDLIGKKMDQIVVNTKFKAVIFHNKDKNKVIKENKALAAIPKNIKLSNIIPRTPRGLNRKNTFCSHFQKLKNNDLFRLIMMVFQYPSPYHSNKDLHLSLQIGEKIQIMLVKSLSVVSPIPNIYINELGYDSILAKAKDNYFQYQNTCYPIFIEEGFELSQRAPIIRSTILTCGLLWVESNEIKNALLSYFLNIIELYFMNPLRLSPKFENLQCTLLLIVNLSHLPWIRYKFNNLVFFCHRTAYTLGLNLTSKGIHGVLKRERALAYCIISITYSGISTFVTAALTNPYKPKVLDRKYNRLILFLGNPNLQSCQTKESIRDSINRIFATQLLDSYAILISIDSLKGKYCNPDNTDTNLEKLSQHLFQKIDMLKNSYIGIYRAIHQEINKAVSDIILNNLLNSTHLYCHYFRFLLYSLKLQRSPPLDESPTNTKIQTIIDHMLKEAQVVIQHMLLLSKHFVKFTTTTCLTHCAIFILRHANKDFKLMSYVMQALLFLKEVGETPFLAHIAKFNGGLIKISMDSFINT